MRWWSLEIEWTSADKCVKVYRDIKHLQFSPWGKRCQADAIYNLHYDCTIPPSPLPRAPEACPCVGGKGMEDSILTIFCCQHMLVLFMLLMKISRIPCSFHASLVCKDSFFSNQPAQCVVILQSSITMTCITGTALWTWMMVLMVQYWCHGHWESIKHSMKMPRGL